MALTWHRETYSQTVTANASPGVEALLVNNLDSDESHLMTIVDGIITLKTDGDDIFSVRLLHIPEALTIATVSATIPDESDRMVYYHWHVAGGPLVYRLRAKRSLHAGERLYLQSWKETGSVESTLHVGTQVATVDHQ